MFGTKQDITERRPNGTVLRKGELTSLDDQGIPQPRVTPYPTQRAEVLISQPQY